MHARHLRRLRNTALIGTGLLLLVAAGGAAVLIVVLDTMTSPVEVEILDVDPNPTMMDASLPDPSNPILWGAA